MDPERWKRVEELFHATLELPPTERAAELARRCGADVELRGLVERLLRDDERGGGALDAPAFEHGAELPDRLLGSVIGTWRLVSRVGAGGMGVVYRAERADGLFEQEVAVKLLLPGLASANALRRFDLERRTLAALNHPNIARLYDGGTTAEGNPYLVMEFVRGAPIDTYCDEHRLSIEERVRLFAQVCQAVDYAHTSLVVHRDLKPGNVLVDEGGVPKLVDFGIARLLADDDEGLEPVTATHARALTPEYASPEQLAGQRLTTATDVYSLGVLLYVLLTGKRPFRMTSTSPIAWMRQVSERTPTRPSSAVSRREPTGTRIGPAELDPAEFAERCRTTPARLRGRLLGDLDRIVLVALRKEPERRYRSARELALDLERHLAGRPVSAREDSPLYVLSKFARRHRLGVAAGAAVIAALVWGIVSARRGERIAAEQAQHARVEAESFHAIANFLMADFLAAEEMEDPLRRRAAEEKITRRAEHVRRQFADDVHQRANLIDALGRACMQLQLYDAAEPLLREAHEDRRAHFGEETLEVALSLTSLGELEYRRGDFEAAVGHMRRSLELHRTCAQGTHTDVARAANDLAVALRNLGDADAAVALHEEALALRRAARPDSLPVAESLNNLAGVHLDRGAYELAHACLTEALEIRREILGPVHELSLQSVANLANAAWHVGEHARARELFEESEAELRKLQSLGYPGLVMVLSALASLDIVAGEFDVAQARLEEALALQQELLGSEHPSLATLYVKLAKVHAGSGRREASLASWRDAVELRRASLGDAHPQLATTLREQAFTLIEARELDAARAAAEEAVEILARAPDAHAAELGRAELTLGMCLRAMREPEEARRLFASALERLDGAPGVAPSELELARKQLEASSD